MRSEEGRTPPVDVCKARTKDFPTQQRRVVDMRSLYPNVEGTAYLAYALRNWFSCSSFAGLDHVREPCSAMDCWSAAWINWVGKTAVRSEVDDSIWILLQVFDGRVGLVCCALISRLSYAGLRRQRLAQSCNQQEVFKSYPKKKTTGVWACYFDILRAIKKETGGN